MRRRSREGRSGKKMPVSLGAGDAETAVSQPQERRRKGARTKRRSGSALPAVRLLGRRTGARATGGQEVCRRSREGESGKTMPVSLASRKVARAKDGSASNMRARKCIDAAAWVGAARRCRCRWGLGRRDSGEPATGKTPRGRNWSSARRTCAKARVSNRGERGSRRAGSAWHPGGNARELVPGDRSTSRAVSH